MPTESNDIPPEDVARSTAQDARAWEQTPEAQAELRRLAELGDESIDFSDIPELTARRSRVEHLLDEVGDNPDALAEVLDAVSRRLRHIKQAS